MKAWLRHQRLPILSGILIGTSYIPFYPWALFFGLVPFWIFCLQAENPRKVFIGGWVVQFTLTLIGFHWVAHTAHEFGHLPWIAAVPILFAFCSFANLHIPLAAWLWSKLQRRCELSLGQSAFLLTLFTTAAENLMPMIFPWHHGYPWLWAGWPGFQLADIIGFEGLSLLTIAINGWILWLWLSRQRRQFVWAGITALIFFFLGFNWLGYRHVQNLPPAKDQFHLLNVQGNIGNNVKYYAEQGDYIAGKTITGRYYTLTSKGINEWKFKHPDTPVDFIMWPETAFPDFLDASHQNRLFPKQLKNYVRLLKTPLITGSYSRDASTHKTYNGIFFIGDNGEIPFPPYRKSILLAFGEYFPGAQYLPFLKEIVPAISDFGRGPGPTVYNFHDVSFGPQICYEGLYPDFSRQLAQSGSEVFINVTNDSWFGRWFEPYQHLYMTLARAIEFRRPLVRNTNTGYSTAILADGTVLERSTLHEEWSHVFDIKYTKNPPLTFYTQYGQFLSPALAIFTLLSALVIVFNRRRESKHERAQLN